MFYRCAINRYPQDVEYVGEPSNVEVLESNAVVPDARQLGSAFGEFIPLDPIPSGSPPLVGLHEDPRRVPV
jgi:hypothetical protein